MAKEKTLSERVLILEENDSRRNSHITDIRENIKGINESLKSLVIVIGGSELNNKKGISSMLDETLKKVEQIEKKVDNHEIKIEHGYWWGRGVALGFIGIVFGLVKGWFEHNK